MGQYQDWLQTQEIDRQLQAEIVALEAELARIQERVKGREDAVPRAENALLRALTLGLRAQEAEARVASGGSDANGAISAAGQEQSESLSAALWHWGGAARLLRRGD